MLGNSRQYVFPLVHPRKIVGVFFFCFSPPPTLFYFLCVFLFLLKKKIFISLSGPFMLTGVIA